MDTGPTNHNIEHKLRAYVTRRRREAGARFVLPPYTRRLLQEQVERKFKRKKLSIERANAVLVWLRVKPVWMAAMGIAMVGLATLLLRLSWRPNQAQDLATPEHKTSHPQSVATPASPTRSLRTPDTTPVAAAEGKNVRPVNSTQDDFVAADQPSARTALHRGAVGISQRFVQTEPDRTQNQKVLQDFQIEVANGKLRMLDSDGSVYEAALASVAYPATEQPAQVRYRYTAQPGTPTALGLPSTTTESVPKTGAFDMRARMQAEKGISSRPSIALDVHSSSSIPFVALGTNRTLNQTVAFQGRIVLPKELSQQIKQQSDLVASDPVTLKALLQNATVQGRVVIGVSNQFELNATPK